MKDPMLPGYEYAHTHIFIGEREEYVGARIAIWYGPTMIKKELIEDALDLFSRLLANTIAKDFNKTPEV